MKLVIKNIEYYIYVIINKDFKFLNYYLLVTNILNFLLKLKLIILTL
jgi:hypothetical protein